MKRINQSKAEALYAAVDNSSGFYSGHADVDSRSWMNVTFRIGDAALEQEFVASAAAAELSGLKGHRSVGGLRASIYNAVSKASVDVLVDFMNEFARTRG